MGCRVRYREDALPDAVRCQRGCLQEGHGGGSVRRFQGWWWRHGEEEEEAGGGCQDEGEGFQFPQETRGWCLRHLLGREP